MSASLGPLGSPTSAPWVPQPLCTVALHVSLSNTAQPFAAPTVETYTVCVARSASALVGLAPTSTVSGGVEGQPAGSVALQFALSIIDTAASPTLGTYTVWLSGSANQRTGL